MWGSEVVPPLTLTPPHWMELYNQLYLDFVRCIIFLNETQPTVMDPLHRTILRSGTFLAWRRKQSRLPKRRLSIVYFFKEKKSPPLKLCRVLQGWISFIPLQLYPRCLFNGGLGGAGWAPLVIWTLNGSEKTLASTGNWTPIASSSAS